MSFDALKVTHRVTEVIAGHRYSITFTPGKLERLTPTDWDTLAKFGFPVYLYDVSSLQMRRLPDEPQLEPLIPNQQHKAYEHLKHRAGTTEQAASASSSSTQDVDAKIWKNMPLPSIADTFEPHIMKPKTLLECCQCAKEFVHEYDLSDGLDEGINLMRILNHRGMILEQIGEMTDAAKDKDQGVYLFGLANLLHLVCNMAQKAGLESVLFATLSLKHVTDMKKSFVTEDEAMDKAKELGLTPEAAQKCIHQTPSGRSTLYVKGKLVKPPDFQFPDLRSLVQLAQTEASRKSHAHLTTTTLCL